MLGTRRSRTSRNKPYSSQNNSSLQEPNPHSIPESVNKLSFQKPRSHPSTNCYEDTHLQNNLSITSSTSLESFDDSYNSFDYDTATGTTRNTLSTHNTHDTQGAATSTCLTQNAVLRIRKKRSSHKVKDSLRSQCMNYLTQDDDFSYSFSSKAITSDSLTPQEKSRPTSSSSSRRLPPTVLKYMKRNESRYSAEKNVYAADMEDASIASGIDSLSALYNLKAEAGTAAPRNSSTVSSTMSSKTGDVKSRSRRTAKMDDPSATVMPTEPSCTTSTMISSKVDRTSRLARSRRMALTKTTKKNSTLKSAESSKDNKEQRNQQDGTRQKKCVSSCNESSRRYRRIKSQKMLDERKRAEQDQVLREIVMGVVGRLSNPDTLNKTLMEFAEQLLVEVNNANQHVDEDGISQSTKTGPTLAVSHALVPPQRTKEYQQQSFRQACKKISEQKKEREHQQELQAVSKPSKIKQKNQQKLQAVDTMSKKGGKAFNEFVEHFLVEVDTTNQHIDDSPTASPNDVKRILSYEKVHKDWPASAKNGSTIDDESFLGGPNLPKPILRRKSRSSQGHPVGDHMNLAFGLKTLPPPPPQGQPPRTFGTNTTTRERLLGSSLMSPFDAVYKGRRCTATRGSIYEPSEGEYVDF